MLSRYRTSTTVPPFSNTAVFASPESGGIWGVDCIMNTVPTSEMTKVHSNVSDLYTQPTFEYLRASKVRDVYDEVSLSPLKRYL